MTGLTLTLPPFSQIRKHIEENINNHLDYNINKEKFTILTSAQSDCNFSINCLDMLLTDVPSVVDPLVDPPQGNSDHSSISFSVYEDGF